MSPDSSFSTPREEWTLFRCVDCGEVDTLDTRLRESLCGARGYDVRCGPTEVVRVVGSEYRDAYVEWRTIGEQAEAAFREYRDAGEELAETLRDLHTSDVSSNYFDPSCRGCKALVRWDALKGDG